MKIAFFILFLCGISSLRADAPETNQDLVKNIQALSAALATSDPVLARQLQFRLGQARRGSEVPTTEILQSCLEVEVCLKVTINPEGRVRVAPMRGVPELKKGAAGYALIWIENQSGGKPQLTPTGNYTGGDNPFDLRWLEVKHYGAELNGEPIEYRLLQVRCSKAGRREVTVSFSAGQGTQDLGFRGEAPVLFTVTE